jgi:hypothetical protein
MRRLLRGMRFSRGDDTSPVRDLLASPNFGICHTTLQCHDFSLLEVTLRTSTVVCRMYRRKNNLFFFHLVMSYENSTLKPFECKVLRTKIKVLCE